LALAAGSAAPEYLAASSEDAGLDKLLVDVESDKAQKRM
jgi:hypothetical protein